MVTWLIQEMNPKSDGELRDEASRQGHEVLFWQLKDIMKHNWKTEAEELAGRTRREVNFKGPVHVSTLMARHLMNEGVRMLTPYEYLRCQHYYAYWGKYLTNQGYMMMPLGEVKRHLGETDFFSKHFFMRPDANDKLFTGFLCDDDNEIPTPILGHFDPQTFAEEIAANPFPGLPNLYVMDISLDADGDTYGLLEIGSINSAGYYSCDLGPIVKAMVEETLKLHEEDEVPF